MTVEYHHPSEAFLRSIDIHTLLPQQEPMVMVERLTMFSETAIITETEIHADNLFAAKGVLTTAGIMENIAQTCAARIGYVNKYILHRGIQVGVLAAISGLKVMDHPHVGNTITTTVRVLEQFMGIMLAEASVESVGKLMATTRIKLAVRDEEQ